jgi:hypothetical protein
MEVLEDALEMWPLHCAAIDMWHRCAAADFHVIDITGYILKTLTLPTWSIASRASSRTNRGF